ncbi:hypothetical protein OROGR_029118 [Orobanche gracilis]
MLKVSIKKLGATSTKSQEFIDKVKKEFITLWAKYKGINDTLDIERRCVQIGCNDGDGSTSTGDGLWDELFNDVQAQNEKEQLQEISNEVDKYLADEIEKRSNQTFNLLEWWRGSEARYPVLSMIAKDIFAIPSSTVASESAFSLRKRVVDPFRSSLSPKMVETLVCTNDWLRAEFDIRKDPTEDGLVLYKEIEEIEKRYGIPRLDLTLRTKKKAETDQQTSNVKGKKPKIDVTVSENKKAVLIGLKDRRKNIIEVEKNDNDVNIKDQILRMRDQLVELRGFLPGKITLMIQENDEDNKLTGKSIKDKLFLLVETAKPGDILFIHLIASGCSKGLIIAPDNAHLSDSYFRALIWRAIEIGCNLTFISDCLIEPAPKCLCTNKQTPFRTQPELKESATHITKLIPLKYAIGTYRFLTATNLCSVNILNPPAKKETQNYPCVILLTPVHNSSIPQPPEFVLQLSKKTSLPSLEGFTEAMLVALEKECSGAPPPELFLPLPEGTTSSPQLTTYGAFSKAILDVIQQAGGRVTNLELAKLSMDKLGAMPGLSCSQHSHAFTYFVS